MNNQQNQQSYLSQKRHKPDLKSISSIRTLTKGFFDENDATNIRTTVIKLYEANEKITLSKAISDELVKKYGGQWFVFVSNQSEKIGASISSFNSNEFLTFSIGNSIFKILRLK